MQFIDLAAQQAPIRDRIDAAITRVLDHGRYVMGPEVVELESALASFSSAPHVVSCASGTDALTLALMVHGVGAGDAVFVPTFTFAATAEAVALLGATPVFVDVDPVSFNLDPDQLESAVEGLGGHLRPSGVIAVDLFGLPADYGRITSVAERSGMWVVADAAQSFGAVRDGANVGTMAPLTTTSFFPAKPLGCYGDGGAVIAHDEGHAEVLRSLRVHGAGTAKYDNVRIGINGRLDTLQAAILLEKLAVFPDEIRARQRIADRYEQALRDSVIVPTVPDGALSTWAQYTIQVDGRDALAAHLTDRGVPSAVYYPRPLHLQTAYRRYPRGAGGLAVAERLSERVLSLPMHPYLSDADQDRVVEAVASR